MKLPIIKKYFDMGSFQGKMSIALIVIYGGSDGDD